MQDWVRVIVMILRLASAILEERGAGRLANCLTGCAALTSAIAAAILSGALAIFVLNGGGVVVGKLLCKKLVFFDS